MPSRMKITKNPVFLHYFRKFMGILLFVLKYMYIFLLLKMINGLSWPAKIMVSPFKHGQMAAYHYYRQAGHPRPSRIHRLDCATPQKIGSLCCTLLDLGDGPVRDPGNVSHQELGSFLLVQIFFYGPWLNFDSSEMIYILIYTKEFF